MGSFGDLLRKYRVAAGLTQETLAERAGMSLAAIGKLERGAHQRPYLATIAHLAQALSLSSNDRLELERAASRGTHASSKPSQEPLTAIALPVHFSRFVGRDHDLSKVHEMLLAHRLVTLVGAGGVGKTRLAIRAAEQYINANATGRRLDGVWFVDFSPLTDGAMLVMTVTSSIGAAHCRTLDALISHLRPQTFLFVLDNCEHLLGPVADFVKAVLSGSPHGRVLATSRQALSLDGERIYTVPPLNLPASDALSARDALAFDAIELFKDRAEATDSRFELTDSVVPAVIEICRRVDGIALGIELAAARANAFSPTDIARQIGEHFSLLTGGDRTSLARHKTMRSLFEWSYELLNAREREVFRRSSIFMGGFTLDLLSGLYAETSDVAPLLASLVNKSLIQCDILVEPTRYRLLEPIRQYANEKLEELGEHEAAARSHALALLALAEEFDSRLDLISDREWDEYIERERDNFRAAFEWAFGAHGDVIIGQRLAASRTATWSGFASGEVRSWIGVARESHGEATPPELQAKLALNAARAVVVFGPSWHQEDDPEASIRTCKHALDLQDPEDFRAVASAKYWLGIALQNIGRFDEADKMLREARMTAHSVGAQHEYYAATSVLGAVRYGAGDLEEAAALVSEVLQRTEEAGSERLAADARAGLAEIAFASGRVEEALQLSEKTTQFFRSHSNLVGAPMTLSNSAAYLIALERYDEAREHALEALERSRALGSVHSAFWAMQHLAAAAVFVGHVDDGETSIRRAASLLGFVDEATERRGMSRYNTEQREYDNVLASIREVLGEDELAALMTAGKTWSEERALVEALSF